MSERRVSRVVAGLLLGGVTGTVGWAVDSVFGIEGAALVVSSALAGFVIGYAVGLWVVDVLLDVFA